MGKQRKWISFGYRRKSKSGKTFIWGVVAEGGEKLGEVRWYAPWRRYALYPQPGTVWEKTCLRDVANFCGIQTEKHRGKK